MTRGKRGSERGARGGSGDYPASDYSADGAYDSDAYAAAGYPRQAGYSYADQYAGPEGYAPSDRYPASDGYPAPGGYDAAAGYAPGQYMSESFVSDRYAPDSSTAGGYPPGRYPDGYGPDGYPADDRYGASGGYDGGYDSQSGYGLQDGAYGGTAGYPSGAYAESDSYDQPDGADAYSYHAAGGYSGAEDYPSGVYAAPAYSQEMQAPYAESDRYGQAGQDSDRYDDSASGWLDTGGEPARDTSDRSGGDRGASRRDGFIPGLDDTRGGRRGGRRKRKVGRVLAPLLAVVMLGAVAAAGYKYYPRFHTPDYTGSGTGQVTVHVTTGATATSLAPVLVRLGVVASTKAFVDAANASKSPDGLQPGFFSLHKHMKASLAYALLLDPKSRVQTTVAIPEGLRLSQIISLLQQKVGKGLSADAYANAVKDTAALDLPQYANGNPEGYLFPATYDVTPGESPLTVLQAMVARFNQEAQSINLPAAAATGQMTPGAIITLASLLQAEVGPQYYAQAAEVIYNRLNQHDPLGLDSTVNFALNRFGVSLTQSQLAVNSPYNTFIHAGLPPGPIDSPGDAAIQAALHPDHGDLLYFVTVNLQTGQTLFTDNAAQFNQDVLLCQQNKAC